LREEDKLQYSIENLVKVAKRENNLLRPYLYVNPLQGKHIPTNPKDVMDMCRTLAKMVNAAYPDDKLYVIGFAETATGIAAAVSHYLSKIVYYQNTTREYREDEEYLFFTESHSHATEQMLRVAGVRECIRRVNRVIFIDDEVTTGSTICKLINVIKEKYDVPNLRCSIVSILNSMPKERINLFKKRGIDFLYLMELPFEYKKDSIMDVEYDENKDTVIESGRVDEVDEIEFLSDTNARNILDFKKYDEENKQFADFVKNALRSKHYRDVLILGTEEFMYPAFCLGDFLLKGNRVEEVRVHATTRSPIIASGQVNYPLFSRYCIKSLYDDSRVTYVYNLREYEKVVIVTDALNRNSGVSDLLHALKSVGNRDIILTRWHYK
jgi:orotate phosphoribosyltransferase